MKRITFLVMFLIIQLGIIIAQDTIPLISGCLSYEISNKSAEITCLPGVYFYYSNDTLQIHGTFGANCCGAHFALVDKSSDTIYLSTIDTGLLCTCSCEFCFEIYVPATSSDTLVYFNGTLFNTKTNLSSINNYYKLDKLVQITPNPFDNQLTISTDFGTIQSLWISDLSGRTIQNFNYRNSKEIIINTASMNSGIYFVNLRTTDNKLITKKIIKQ